MSKGLFLDGISKAYDKEATLVLKNICLRIEAGDIATLFGPSGSGKSTILNLASGLDYPTEGSIRLGEDLVSNFDAHQWTLFRRKNIGFIFQSYNLFPSLNALENVEIISLLNGEDKTFARSMAIEALGKVGLSERMTYYPGELSGGQQQRVAVARAIASRPKIIFADEPTANLDSHTAKSIIELLFDLNKTNGTTILFSTHDNNIIEKVNTVIRVKDGEIFL